jgi:hypothetical protein
VGEGGVCSIQVVMEGHGIGLQFGVPVEPRCPVTGVFLPGLAADPRKGD